MKRLEAHVKEKHAGPPPPKKKKLCPVCGEEVNDLVQHSKTHKLYDERKFVCVLCDKKFETQYALRRHKFNVHSNEKPIQCELCGKNFKTESNMKDHHKHIHVNGKVYQCGSCPRNFIQRFYYEKHLVNKHGIVTQLLEYGPDEQELKLEGTAATS
ncbi:putative zinc finger protein [Orchesella cincta]|uniref:Putative zinc finger protein n=1 Tax=Orchesella cincta TaxID=48709 RepID=A0A1D2M1L5_ORCCI|nr:putative zinc finger protein [Orchesella cincta]